MAMKGKIGIENYISRTTGPIYKYNPSFYLELSLYEGYSISIYSLEVTESA